MLDIAPVVRPVARAEAVEPLDLEFPYCTEFIVKGASVDKKTVSEALDPFGNSMIVAVVEDIVKVHIHTKNPGNALNIAQNWGTDFTILRSRICATSTKTVCLPKRIPNR